MTDFTNLNPRAKAVAEALFDARNTDSGQLTVDTLRRKLQTTKTNVVEALTELEGAYEEVSFDSDAQVAMWEQDVIDGEAILDQPDDGAADKFANAPYGADQDAERDADTAFLDEESDSEDAESVRTFRFPDHKKVEYAEKGGNCGDRLAEALTNYLNHTTFAPRKDGKGEKKIKGIDMVALRQVADANGVAVVNGANPGQMRMNLSNVLRAMWRKGTSIVVGDTIVPGLQFKSRAAWIEECARAHKIETGSTLNQARAHAEQEFEVKSEAGEYDPYSGTFV